jgi:hypothetical protein
LAYLTGGPPAAGRHDQHHPPTSELDPEPDPVPWPLEENGPPVSENVNQITREPGVTRRTNDNQGKRTRYTEAVCDPTTPPNRSAPNRTADDGPGEGAAGKPWPEFWDWVRLAVEEHNRRRDDGSWPEWQELFGFVRLVKAHPDMEGTNAGPAFRHVKKVVMRWRHAIPEGECSCGWCHWLGVCAEDAEVAFLDTWEKIRYLPGQTPLQNAFRLAREYPLELRDEDLACRTEGYQWFIRVAGWLQFVMADRPIMLPVELLGKALGVKPMTVSRYRKWAVADGYLKEIRPYEFRGKGKGGKATEFVFDVSRFPILEEKAL